MERVVNEMSLTKEKCLFALESFKPANIYEFIAKGYLPFTEANSILTQLINEHFEIIKEKEQLEKALDKACELISSDVCINCYACYFEKECKSKEADKCIANNMNKEEWKEWCLKDVD